jgi:hypothetical protein
VKSAKAFARAVIVAAVVMGPATPADAATPVVVDWDRTPPLSGTVVHSTVRIESPSDGGAFQLAVIDHPPVDGPGYAIWGKIRYTGVQGAGFLEMWSVFPAWVGISAAPWTPKDRLRGSPGAPTGAPSSSRSVFRTECRPPGWRST